MRFKEREQNLSNKDGTAPTKPSTSDLDFFKVKWIGGIQPITNNLGSGAPWLYAEYTCRVPQLR